MSRRFSVNFTIFSIGLDIVLTWVALAFSAYLRPQLSFLPFTAEYPQFIPLPWLVFPVFALVWVSILALFSVYDGRRNFSRRIEFANLTLGTLLAAMALAGTLYLSFREISRLLYIVFVLVLYISMLTWRGIARLIKNFIRNRLENQRRVLILGAGEIGDNLIRQIIANPQFDLHVIGFLDDCLDQPERQAPILGRLEDFQAIIKQQEPDDIVIALPQDTYERINMIIAELHKFPVKVWLIPDYFRLALHKAAVEDFAGIPMLDLRAPALSDAQLLVKRAFDLVITILALPFVLPLTAIIAIIIRLEAPGKIILKQERMGENGRVFKMLKFRTMIPGAEKLPHAVDQYDDNGNWVHKMENDPRVTRVGRILRRFSLDELPQLFNVLKGEMSLVGPRPELPFLVSQYETWQRQRFVVPQGMTGWWQINGRSDRPMHLHTEDDLYYIQHYSLLLDVYILVRTFAVVIQGKGAF